MIQRKIILECIYKDAPDLTKKLKVDLGLDRYDLPGEWDRQHQIYMDWVEIWAFSVMERDRKKADLELNEANMDSRIRKDPKKYGVEKITEGAVKSAITCSKDHQACVDNLHRATLFMNRMAGAKLAFEQRRKALENLTELAIAGFYSANSGPSEAQVGNGTKARKQFAQRMAAKR